MEIDFYINLAIYKLALTFSAIIVKAKDAYKNKGLVYLLRNGIRVIPTCLWFIYYKRMQVSSPSFWCMGKEFAYLYDVFNNTWSNERCIEVPIALDFMQKYKGMSILEVGNVLSNYVDTDHDIVDKYEKGPKVINEDLEVFRPAKKYDLVLSVSTLEHVGFDEIPPDERKIPRALQNLMTLLNTNGTLLVTIPRGYNKILDRYIDTKKIQFDEQYYMKRISKDNIWKQSTWNEVKNSIYGYPYNAANALIIGINSKS